MELVLGLYTYDCRVNLVVDRLLSSKDELASTVLGTPYCLSPEICKSMPYSYKSDVCAA